MKLIWRLYPLVDDQQDEKQRLEYITSPYYERLTDNPEDFPYVEYQLDFTLKEKFN